jgi:hypothetical protein
MPDSPGDPDHALREHARKSLGFMIGSLLTNGEPSLVAQARQARSSVEQSQCYDAIRELRLKGRPLQELFVLGILAGFDEAGQPRPAPVSQDPLQPPPHTTGLESLGVLKDAHLEQQIAVENIASRATHEHREALLSIGRQFARRSGSRRVDIDSLPLGPQKLASTFMESCARAGVEPGAMLLLSRLFTRFVIDELGPFYQECIQLLPAEQEAQAMPLTAPEASTEPTTPASGAEVAGMAPVEPAPEAGWDPARTPLLLPPGRAMAMPRSQLDEALFSVQESILDPANAFFSSNPKGGVQLLRIQELLNDTLAESGASRPMSLPADVVEAMGLVRLLFEHALRDSRVPPAIRRIMRLLEVPFLRLALREPEMLSTATHPARVLFTEVGVAAAGRPPAGDPGSEDFPRLVQLLVMRVLGDYEKDSAVFSEALQDLRRYLAVHGGASAGAADPQSSGAGPAPVPRAVAPATARAPASPEFQTLVEKIPLDGWIELRPQGSERRRLKLLGRVPRTGQFIFGDDSGQKVAEWSRSDLASMIENGEAVIIKEGGARPSGRR